MNVAAYVAQFIAGQGIKHSFGVTGGANIHTLHAIYERDDTDFICVAHEQAGAMAADAYSRVTGNLGCAIATSGPGATNLITGICCSYFDSVPVLYITGQVTTFRLKGDTGVRQMGFQETEIVAMVKPVTKYAVMITDPKQIRYELEKAVYIAKSGRPGPVLVDIPDDIQRMEVDAETLEGFDAWHYANGSAAIDFAQDDLSYSIFKCIPLIAASKRPVLVVGWGVRLAGAVQELLELADCLGIPIAPSWAALDMFGQDEDLLAGGFGTQGTRAGNFAVANADLILAIGARLSTRETGSPLSLWAREAKTIVVDIDPTELGKFPKFGRPIDVSVVADAKAFIIELMNHPKLVHMPATHSWRRQVSAWKERYPICPPELYKQEPVNPYVFMEELSEATEAGDQFFVDTGCAVAWMMQGFKFRPDQRIYHAFNNTPMGYALPAAIGGCFALDKKRVICIAGDGALLMNMQELCTASRHNLPIKLFVMNNNGYSMVQQTQEEWLDGAYHASTVEGGLAFPDFRRLAESCGWSAVEVDRNRDLRHIIREVLAMPGPVLCDVRIPSTHRVIPKSKFGYPIEDAEPLLPRREFFEQMIVEPAEISKKPI